MKHHVAIIEQHTRIYEVDADDREEAEAKAHAQWRTGFDPGVEVRTRVEWLFSQSPKKCSGVLNTASEPPRIIHNGRSCPVHGPADIGGNAP